MKRRFEDSKTRRHSLEEMLAFTVFLLFFWWLSSEMGTHYTRLWKGWVVSTTTLALFSSVYAPFVGSVLHAKWVWSTQLIMIVMPVFLLWVCTSGGCEIYHLQPRARIPQITGTRWRSSDPEVLSQISKTFVLPLVSNDLLQNGGTLIVNSTRLSDVSLGRVVVEQTLRLCWNESDFLDTFTVCTKPVDRYVDEVEWDGGRLPWIADTRIRMTGGKFAGLDGRVEVRYGVVYVWLE